MRLWKHTTVRFMTGYVGIILFFLWFEFALQTFITPASTCDDLCDPKVITGIIMLTLSPLVGLLAVISPNLPTLRQRRTPTSTLVLRSIKGIAYIWIILYLCGVGLYLISTSQSEGFWLLPAGFAFWLTPIAPIIVLAEEYLDDM